MTITYATADNFHCATLDELRPILDALNTITWPCPADAIQDITSRLGWNIISDRVHVKALVDLPLNWRVADFSRPDGIFTQLGFPVSDVVDASDCDMRTVVQDAFAKMTEELSSVLGPVDGQMGAPARQAWWELPSNGRIKLELLSGNVQMRVLSKQLADVERFEETHDMSEYPEDE